MDNSLPERLILDTHFFLQDLWEGDNDGRYSLSYGVLATNGEEMMAIVTKSFKTQTLQLGVI